MKTDARLKFEWGNFLQGGLLLFLAGIFFIFAAGIPIWKTLFPANWQPATAEVVAAEQIESQLDSGRINVNYRFEYRYAVNGKIFTGTRYSLKYASGSPNEGVKRFSVGDNIPVFYDAENPAFAVVKKGEASFFTYAAFLFGILLLVMGAGLTFGGDVAAGILWLSQRPRRPAQRKPMSTVTASGTRFMANEQVRSMPKDLRAELLVMIHRGDSYAAIQHYRQKTAADPRMAAYVIEQLAEFDRRGLLADDA